MSSVVENAKWIFELEFLDVVSYRNFGSVPKSYTDFRMGLSSSLLSKSLAGSFMRLEVRSGRKRRKQ